MESKNGTGSANHGAAPPNAAVDVSAAAAGSGQTEDERKKTIAEQNKRTGNDEKAKKVKSDAPKGKTRNMKAKIIKALIQNDLKSNLEKERNQKELATPVSLKTREAQQL